MSVTGDAMYIKKMNKALVLNTIRNNTPISRAKVSKITGLNKGTVSNLVSELIHNDLVYETGTGKSSGGRRPIMLMFNERCGYAIGIDIGVNYIFGLLTDLSGKIITKKEISLSVTDYQSVKENIYTVIDFLINQTPSSTYNIIGIGVSVPAIVSNEGFVLFAPNLNWTNINLKHDLQQKYSLNVTVENEANAGAYGELKFGNKNHVETMIFISAGMGIGSGIIINDTLYKGINGFSGEVGHVSIENNGIVCTCGKKGCWELYASEKAILNKTKEVYQKEISFLELVEKAKKQDQKAIHIFNEIGKQLGIGISNVINIFNPDSVVIGNRIASSKTWIEDSLKETIKSRTLPFHQKEVEIRISNLGPYSIPLGVSYIMIEDFLKK
ncbi:ROK family protein [Oceanobacillus damuensis]|uniref:ROK family protein n=1 Tax=Oceanobacillus damuensis TaxID=937928 RepID=UPI00082B305D|nr:ROK family protein [Oceanobacillus damuensis]